MDSLVDRTDSFQDARFCNDLKIIIRLSPQCSYKDPTAKFTISLEEESANRHTEGFSNLLKSQELSFYSSCMKRCQ